MSITSEEKARLVRDYGASGRDTGSSEVQVAILSSRIARLTDHFKSNAKDNHSRRGLLKLVAQRRRARAWVAAAIGRPPSISGARIGNSLSWQGIAPPIGNLAAGRCYLYRPNPPSRSV